MADPWLKFYPQDWRADERLRNCTLAARGLWIEMLALMHRSDRYGYLLVNGKPPTDQQLAVQAGAPVDEIKAALGELEAEGVFSRDRNGTIYSRRMIRDEKRAKHARKVGRKGGNPNLSKRTENQAQDNQADKPNSSDGLTPICQKPEARVPPDKSGGSRAGRGSRLPADFKMPEVWLQWAIGERHWSPEDAAAEASNFTDFWHGKTGKDATKLDWLATWRVWVRNSRRPGIVRAASGWDGMA